MAVFSIQHPTFYLLNSDWAKFRIASISLLHWTLTRFQDIAQYPHSVTPRIPRSSLQHCQHFDIFCVLCCQRVAKRSVAHHFIWRLSPCPTENNVSSFADSSAVWSLFRGRTFVNTSCSRMYVLLPFTSNTDSLGIGNEKGAMITHHAFMLHDDCSVFTKLALKNR